MKNQFSKSKKLDSPYAIYRVDNPNNGMYFEWKILKTYQVKSNEDKNNFWPNLENIRTNDEIKFVIQDYEDFSWSMDIIEKYQLNQSQILFSPVYNVLASEQLAEWILKHQLNVRLQLQLHKILWGEKKGV